MNKKFKKICSIALTLAITAASAISMSLSADCIFWDSFTNLSDFTVIDDKGMMKNHVAKEGYKMLYQDGKFFIAEPRNRISEFVISEDVDYEEANERIIEIFEEFYPDNYLGVSPEPTEGMPPTNETYPAYIEYVLNYSKNYKPNLWANTVDGVTTYTLCAIDRQMPGIEEEKIAEVKKYSKAFMKKLYEENLISAFYDFGEIYSVSPTDHNKMLYFKDIDIDLINNYIKENNIDCTIEKNEYADGDYCYILKSNDNDALKNFLIAADIYEATSIDIEPINTEETMVSMNVYGKNALEELSSETNLTGDANGDGELSIRDAAFIAISCAKGQYEDIPEWADYNGDGERNIRDAASIAIYLASR